MRELRVQQVLEVGGELDGLCADCGHGGGAEELQGGEEGGEVEDGGVGELVAGGAGDGVEDCGGGRG